MMDDHKKRLRLQSSALPVRAHKPRNADELRKKIKQGFEVALSLSASRPRSHAPSSAGVDLPGFSPSRPRSHARAVGLLPSGAFSVRAHKLRNADELLKKIKQDLEAALSFSPSHRQAEECGGKT